MPSRPIPILQAVLHLLAIPSTTFPAQAISFKGVADGGTVTVRGNTVTMNPNKAMGAPGSSENGRALLKVWYVPTQLTLSNGATFIVEDNVVSIVARRK